MSRKFKLIVGSDQSLGCTGSFKSVQSTLAKELDALAVRTTGNTRKEIDEKAARYREAAELVRTTDEPFILNVNGYRYAIVIAKAA